MNGAVVVVVLDTDAGLSQSLRIHDPVVTQHVILRSDDVSAWKRVQVRGHKWGKVRVSECSFQGPPRVTVAVILGNGSVASLVASVFPRNKIVVCEGELLGLFELNGRVIVGGTLGQFVVTIIPCRRKL